MEMASYRLAGRAEAEWGEDQDHQGCDKSVQGKSSGEQRIQGRKVDLSWSNQPSRLGCRMGEEPTHQNPNSVVFGIMTFGFIVLLIYYSRMMGHWIRRVNGAH